MDVVAVVVVDVVVVAVVDLVGLVVVVGIEEASLDARKEMNFVGTLVVE